MSNWADAANELAQLIELGTTYEADVNAQDLNVPGYWIVPVSRSFDTLAAKDFTAVFDVYAITNVATASDALYSLSDMQDALNDLAAANPQLLGMGTTAEIEAVQLNAGTPQALPAIKMTITLEVD